MLEQTNIEQVWKDIIEESKRNSDSGLFKYWFPEQKKIGVLRGKFYQSFFYKINIPSTNIEFLITKATLNWTGDKAMYMIEVKQNEQHLFYFDINFKDIFPALFTSSTIDDVQSLPAKFFECMCPTKDTMYKNQAEQNIIIFLKKIIGRQESELSFLQNNRSVFLRDNGSGPLAGVFVGAGAMAQPYKFSNENIEKLEQLKILFLVQQRIEKKTEESGWPYFKTTYKLELDDLKYIEGLINKNKDLSGTLLIGNDTINDIIQKWNPEEKSQDKQLTIIQAINAKIESIKKELTFKDDHFHKSLDKDMTQHFLESYHVSQAAIIQLSCGFNDSQIAEINKGIEEYENEGVIQLIEGLSKHFDLEKYREKEQDLKKCKEKLEELLETNIPKVIRCFELLEDKNKTLVEPQASDKSESKIKLEIGKREIEIKNILIRCNNKITYNYLEIFEELKKLEPYNISKIEDVKENLFNGLNEIFQQEIKNFNEGKETKLLKNSSTETFRDFLNYLRSTLSFDQTKKSEEKEKALALKDYTEKIQALNEAFASLCEIEAEDAYRKLYFQLLEYVKLNKLETREQQWTKRLEELDKERKKSPKITKGKVKDTIDRLEPKPFNVVDAMVNKFLPDEETGLTPEQKYKNQLEETTGKIQELKAKEESTETREEDQWQLQELYNEKEIINLELQRIEKDRNIINEIIRNKDQQNYIPNPSYQEAEQAKQPYGLYCWNQAIQQKYKCSEYKIKVNGDSILLSNEQQTITINNKINLDINNPQHLEKIIVAACKLQLTSKNKENIEKTEIDGLTLKSEYVTTKQKMDSKTSEVGTSGSHVEKLKKRTSNEIPTTPPEISTLA